MTTSIPDLERLEAECPKPWRHVVHGLEDLIEFRPGDYSDDITPANAALAVVSRNALPDLLAVIRIAVTALKNVDHELAHHGALSIKNNHKETSCWYCAFQDSYIQPALAEIQKLVTL